MDDIIPDEKTIWSYREVLVETKIFKRLFNRFDRYLEELNSSIAFNKQKCIIRDAESTYYSRENQAEDNLE